MWRNTANAGQFTIDDGGDVAFEPRLPSLGNDWSELASVREQGRVAWRQVAGLLQVSFRPALTTPAAHARLLSWLSDARAARIVVCAFYDGGWQHHILGDARSASACVDALMARYGCDWNARTYRRIRSLQSSFDDRGFARSLEFWRERRSDFDPAPALSTLDTLLDSSWILFECSPDNAFCLADYGDENPAFAKRWMTRNLGAPLLSLPDKAYAESVVEVYRGVDATGEPCLDDVDAFASWVSYGRVRSRYSRLMLPFSSGGKRWVLTAKSKKATFDLIS